MQCTRHLPAMSNWNRMQWNMPTVDGLRLIEGQSNCSKGRACICSCFRSVKYDRYYLHFFWHSHACLVTVSVSVSAFGFSPKQLCGFADALASLSLLCYSFCSFFASFHFFILFTSYALYMSHIYLVISHLNLSLGLKHLSSSSSINLSCCYKIISFSGHKGQAHLLCRPPPFFQVQLLCK